MEEEKQAKRNSVLLLGAGNSHLRFTAGGRQYQEHNKFYFGLFLYHHHAGVNHLFRGLESGKRVSVSFIVPFVYGSSFTVSTQPLKL